jgi:hypothetical protein
MDRTTVRGHRLMSGRWRKICAGCGGRMTAPAVRMLEIGNAARNPDSRIADPLGYRSLFRGLPHLGLWLSGTRVCCSSYGGATEPRHKVRREVSVPVLYKGKELARHRLDMIVDDKVVIETKATETLHRGAVHQVTSYLRSTNLEVGLLLHFGPRPEFSRVVCTNSNRADPKVVFQRNPPLPPLPRNVSDTNPGCDPLRDSEPA